MDRKMDRVLDMLGDGSWHTLGAVTSMLYGEPPHTRDHLRACGAVIRDLRKAKNGGWTVEVQGTGNAERSYRIPNQAAAPHANQQTGASP